MSHKKDRRIVQSEQAIIEAGISALLLNPSAGMSEIAQFAGVGRATLYRHFESREALIRKLAIVCAEETDIALEPYAHLTGRAAIEAVIDVLVPMADRFRFLIAPTRKGDRQECVEVDGVRRCNPKRFLPS